MSRRGTRGWVRLEDAIRAAGADADPAEQARVLRDAGADLTRDPAGRWYANPKDPRVIRWMRDLTKMAG